MTAAASLALTNCEKIFWPAVGFTKGQMLDYYRAIAPVMLPHLAGRPVTLARFPEGVDGRGWYQNDCAAAPAWLHTESVRGQGGRALRYAVIDDVESLLWATNWGAIELHPFLAPAQRRDAPDYLVIDLDPGPPAGLLACCAVALHVRAALRATGLDPYVKTSGRAGLHLFARLPEADRTYARTKALARAIGEELARTHPELVVATMSRAARAGHVYLDWGQNDANKSTIAAYSLRATPLPWVSTPLTWGEVEQALQDGTPRGLIFGPAEVLNRVERHGDLFAPLRRDQ
ncbi:MAG: non-homologous end-joining DNA ligase [Polyangia bacterium]